MSKISVENWNDEKVQKEKAEAEMAETCKVLHVAEKGETENVEAEKLSIEAENVENTETAEL